jgi:hypothetical protein
MMSVDALIPGESERGAAHEAGHMIVALALGVLVIKVSRDSGANIPTVLREQGFDAAVGVDYSDEIHKLEPRRQFVAAFGGMAGETLSFGFYNKQSAAHDFEAIKPNVLSDKQVQGLVDIGQSMILANLGIFNYVKVQLRVWLDNPNAAPLLGDTFNQRFLQRGKQVDISEQLNTLLPV